MVLKGLTDFRKVMEMRFFQILEDLYLVVDEIAFVLRVAFEDITAAVLLFASYESFFRRF